MKKKIFGLFAFVSISLFAFCNNVYAAKDIKCAALGDVVIDSSIADTVALVIKGIMIAVPILLVIFGMIDLLKGVAAQKEDEIKKGQQTFFKRVIAAIIVFFVIAIVKAVVSAVSGNSEIMDCANCFINGSKDCKAGTTVQEQNPGNGPIYTV